MTTIVNTPPSSDNSSGLMNLIIGLIILIVVGYLGFVYGLPALQNMKLGSPQINVPDKIDINVNQNSPSP